MTSFRIVVLGSGGVGTTPVILRFLRDTFDEDYVPTIQDSFAKPYMFNGKIYKLTIVDSAGQDEMESINNLAIKSADGFVLLYSVISSMSFGELDKFIAQIHQNFTGSNPKIVIGGTKCEMDDDRAVTTEQGQAKCEELGYPFFECSAKNNINITPMFEECMRLILTGNPKSSSDEGNGGCCNVG
jgi:small GTP-binding protein